jgi:hypothetical protein
VTFSPANAVRALLARALSGSPVTVDELAAHVGHVDGDPGRALQYVGEDLARHGSVEPARVFRAAEEAGDDEAHAFLLALAERKPASEEPAPRPVDPSEEEETTPGPQAAPIIADGLELGWVRLWRKIVNSAVFADPHLLQLWCWILMRANHIRRAVPVWTGRGQTLVDLAPGQLIFGRNTAAKALKCPGSTIQGRLQTLKKLKMVVIQPVTHYSVISIVNWALYQEDAPAIRQATRHSPRHPSVTNKNYKKRSTTGANGVRPVLDFYAELFEAKIGQPPDISWAKDGAIIKALLASRSEGDLRDLLRRFFESPDPFIRQSGYTIGAFKSQLNKLLVAKAKPGAAGYLGTAGRRLEQLS